MRSLKIFIIILFISMFALNDIMAASSKISIYKFMLEQNSAGENSLQEMLPQSIFNNLEKNQDFTIDYISEEQQLSDINDNSYEKYLQDLQQEAITRDSDFLITGKILVDNNLPVVVINIYVKRFNNIIKIKSLTIENRVTVEELGSDLSNKIIYEILKISKNESNYPVINPRGGNYMFGTNVIIESPLNNADIYYSLDGSEPSPEISSKYEKPIKITKNTTLKAILHKQNWIATQAVVEKYKVKYYVPLFSVNFLFGLTDYQLSYSKKMGSIFYSPIVSTTMAWEFANVEAFQQIPVIRNFVLIGIVDSISAPEKSKIGNKYIFHNNLITTAGLLYKFRILRYFSIDLTGSAGSAYTNYTKEKTEKILIKKPAPLMNNRYNESNDLAFNGTIGSTIFAGTIALNPAVSIKHIRLDKGSSTMAAYQLGFSIRF